jgi:hypothetical protein
VVLFFSLTKGGDEPSSSICLFVRADVRVRRAYACMRLRGVDERGRVAYLNTNDNCRSNVRQFRILPAIICRASPVPPWTCAAVCRRSCTYLDGCSSAKPCHQPPPLNHSTGILRKALPQRLGADLDPAEHRQLRYIQ